MNTGLFILGGTNHGQECKKHGINNCVIVLDT